MYPVSRYPCSNVICFVNETSFRFRCKVDFMTNIALAGSFSTQHCNKNTKLLYHVSSFVSAFSNLIFQPCLSEIRNGPMNKEN